MAEKQLTSLEKKYREAVVPALMKEFQFGNIMQVPRLQKIVVNMGLGEAVQNQKIIESAVEELSTITGQKPVLWMSDHGVFAPTAALRGGIPVCFPWFGPNLTDNSAPNHGWARISPWTLTAGQISEYFSSKSVRPSR